jgi:hypothetical protein
MHTGYQFERCNSCAKFVLFCLGLSMLMSVALTGGGFLPTAVVCNYLVYLYFLVVYGLSGCLMFKKDASF